MKKGNADLKRERRLGFIMDKLLRGNLVTVAELAEKGTNERTARRTFNAISNLKTQRIRGGISPAGLYYHDCQLSKHLNEKQDVAETAAKYLSSNASIAASAGTTVAATHQTMVTEKGVSPVVVTNSLALVNQTEAGEVFLVGGRIDPQSNATSGEDTEKGLKRYPCREGLVGVSGIIPVEGEDATLHIHHAHEAPLIRAILMNVTDLLVIVADIHKLGKGDPWRLATIRELEHKEYPHRKVVLVTNKYEDWKTELGDKFEKAKETYDRLQKLADECDNFNFIGVKRRDQSD